MTATREVVSTVGSASNKPTYAVNPWKVSQNAVLQKRKRFSPVEVEEKLEWSHQVENFSFNRDIISFVHWSSRSPVTPLYIPGNKIDLPFELTLTSWNIKFLRELAAEGWCEIFRAAEEGGGGVCTFLGSETLRAKVQRCFLIRFAAKNAKFRIVFFSTVISISALAVSRTFEIAKASG